ncbi:hypothetical protein ECTOBSL9_1349 [Ectothiorhodospira sp. BSL-9]|nr:hypothetical protein ECTOBSL9_1349 [Ectothiorhodospira sp. BSL-9]
MRHRQQLQAREIARERLQRVAFGGGVDGKTALPSLANTVVVSCCLSTFSRVSSAPAMYITASMRRPPSALRFMLSWARRLMAFLASAGLGS